MSLTTPVAPGALSSPRRDGAEKRSMAGMAAVVVLLNLVGWGVLFLAVVPQGLTVGSAGVFGVGVGATAFLLGVRHAFDADHIAAIDNTTRKLVGEGRPASSVGFWFSLGHSSVVFGLALVLALGLRVVVGPVADDGSALQHTLGTVGGVVAGTFLVLIGLLNLGSVAGIVRVLREMRGAPLDEAELERHLNSRGLLARVLSRFTRRVREPWHMYPVGLLMGLGFDTATQVALLVLAGGTAALTLPWYAILVLPVLFAAGMSLFDAADGVLMARAYRWAFLAPVRKVYYNLTVTILSVVAALGIGATVLLQLLAERLGATRGILGWAAGLDLRHVGYALVALFVVTWVTGLAVWRLGRFERRGRSAGTG
ncbi:HoxN/HupN/NixA family nickel/cobalt transporter [Myceligenerans xiligouense]|uniref:Nickel/cobalt efflux system n=1 Tax=Myceligenerans xiligouense TaxID=253184 RepID=A0A3N4Z7P7_9MICO|nr:HoxN/HupN/NixA family nickel/cobalt transporter [Myceligenerans xiligouense]RPF21352.1 high-affinity nickel-transport protein [Myceligenerans xiligouense]